MCQMPSLCALRESTSLAVMPVWSWLGILQAIWESSRKILGVPSAHRRSWDLWLHHDGASISKRRRMTASPSEYFRNSNTFFSEPKDAWGAALIKLLEFDQKIHLRKNVTLLPCFRLPEPTLNVYFTAFSSENRPSIRLAQESDWND